MALIDVPTAKKHLRVMHSAEDSTISDYVDAAEEMAQAFLGRNIYADQAALDTAIGAAPAALAAAGELYETEKDAAAAMDYGIEQGAAYEAALNKYRAAIVSYERTAWGMVMDKKTKVAILAIVANLWLHRGDEEEPEGIPKVARNFLWARRRVLL